jgi:hypothetical protein
MAQQERDRFVMQLKQTAAERKIPIDRLSCRDLPDKDGFELIMQAVKNRFSRLTSWQQ